MLDLPRVAPGRKNAKTRRRREGATIPLQGAPAGKAIQVRVVGCGGRGSGAAAQALKADDFTELTAMADIYQERIDDSLGRLQKVAKDKVKVEKTKMFVGLDAYQKLIDSDVDVVLLATPPGFRP